MTNYAPGAHAADYDTFAGSFVNQGQRPKCLAKGCTETAHTDADGLCITHGVEAYREEYAWALVNDDEEYAKMMFESYMKLVEAFEKETK